MRENCTCGSLRGAAGNRCPYRDTSAATALLGMRLQSVRRQHLISSASGHLAQLP